MTKPQRMLIYTQDSYGLGHLRRTTILANLLVSRCKDLTILMVVDSPVAPFFDLSEGIDFVKLPTIIKVDAGVFRPDQLSMEYDQVKKMRSAMICDILNHMRPDVMLVDHMPGGANNELLPALQMARRNKLSTKFVLGLRDIIDDPVVTCNLWQREDVYRTMEEYYDAVMIYSSPDTFPTAEKYRISDTPKKKVHYCGYVCNMSPVQDQSAVRKKLSKSGKPVVTVLAGGGADGFRLMNTFLDSLEYSSSEKAFSSIIVTGPFLPGEHSRTIRKRSKKLGVKVCSTLKDTISHINATDVVVSMAGYNTLTEILRLGKSAVVVPRPGPSAEQTMRAEIFSELGMVKALNPHDFSAAHIFNAIQEKLNTPQVKPSGTIPDMNGAFRATEILLNLIG